MKLQIIIYSIFITNFTIGQSFVHPGLLHSKYELDMMRQNVLAQKQPTLNAYNNLKASKYANINYTVAPFAEVKCGSYNKPNVGCNQMVENGMSAYTHALQWYITRDSIHAKKAITFFNAWSSTYERNTESNARLVVSWAAPWYINAAEIIRYSYNGWQPNDIKKFEDMLKKFLPYVTDDTMPGNNWVLSSIEAHMAIGVFLNDVTIFNKAIERWKLRVPTYIYLSSDGANPILGPGRTLSQTLNTWKSKATSTSFIDGMCMETCRDLGHATLGINSMLYAAEIAWHQGTDLFSLEKNRLKAFFELHAGWMLGLNEIPATICGGVVKAREPDKEGIKPPNGGGATPFEIAINHLHTRLNIALPTTLKMLLAKRPSSASRWVSKWETLTHGDINPLITNTDKYQTDELLIYPNPSYEGYFNLSYTLEYKVYSMFGAKLLEKNANFVDLRNFDSGLYFLVTPLKTFKILKTK